MIQASEKTKSIVSELTGVLTQNPSSIRNVEIQNKTALSSVEISYGLNYMKSKGLVKSEGANRGTRWTLTTGGEVKAEHAPHTNGASLVKPVMVEISKSCLKLMVKHIVEKGEHLEGPIQQAVMKALLVLV